MCVGVGVSRVGVLGWVCWGGCVRGGCVGGGYVGGGYVGGTVGVDSIAVSKDDFAAEWQLRHLKTRVLS